MVENADLPSFEFTDDQMANIAPVAQQAPRLRGTSRGLLRPIYQALPGLSIVQGQPSRIVFSQDIFRVEASHSPVGRIVAKSFENCPRLRLNPTQTVCRSGEPNVGVLVVEKP